MAKAYYLEDDIRKKIKYLLYSDIDHLYQDGIINYKGVTKDTGQLYTEVVASEILKNVKCLDNISMIHRNNPYRILSHQERVIPDSSSNREEERIAITLLKRSQYGFNNEKGFGKVFDYQIPLKRTNKDKGVGKIDLVSIAGDGNTVFLLELKKRDSKESMLRCVLEAYTYSKQLDPLKFKEEYSDICAQDAVIKPAPLVFIGERQHSEYFDNKHPYLRQLMKVLGDMKPFFITQEEARI